MDCEFYKKCVLLAFLLVIAGSMDRVTCQDDDDDAGGPAETPPEKTCQGAIFGIIKAALPAIPRCLFGPNVINFRLKSIFQAVPRIYCLAKCVAAELGMMDADGNLDEINALMFLQDNIPEYALPTLVDAAGPCLSIGLEFKKNQYYCQSFGPIIQCLSRVIVTGVGPFALECFGVPFMSGLFGVLNFFVPQERPTTEETRRLVAEWTAKTNASRRISVGGTIVSRVRERRKQIQIHHEKLEMQDRLMNPLTFTPTPDLHTQPLEEQLESPAAALSQPRNVGQDGGNSSLSKKKRKDKDAKSTQAVQGFKLSYSWKNVSSNTSHIPMEYHTNNTDTIVYQMDRISNLAKSLQLLMNVNAKPIVSR